MIPRSILIFVCLFVSFGISTEAVFGASSDFRVQTLIGDDTEPPTVPGTLSATPVATTQIDLTWATSTDNYLLSGYHVFRDDVLIATTTIGNYSDVGLTPSTTYTYFITAFDSFGNESASSSPVATTTLSSTTPPSEEDDDESGAVQGSIAALRLARLEVIPERDAVVIRYETSGYTRTIIQWGKTISYELGSLAERSFSKVHETRIIGLTPGTRYTFSIKGENNGGRTRTLTEDTFVTLPLDDTFPPGNVRNLRASIEGDDVVIAWENPRDADFTKVRVLRSTLFYPSDLADGWVVYEHDGETARDVGIAAENSLIYYTVFSYDALGNISSGAVVAVRVEGGVVTPIEVPPETTNPLALALSDVVFMQSGEQLIPIGNRVRVNGAELLTLSLPYDRVPEHLKTILITMTDSVDAQKTFSFLLRINEARTAYVATIAPLGISGDFPFRISVFDYTTTQVGYAGGVIESRIAYLGEESRGDDPLRDGGVYGGITHIFKSFSFWFIILLIILSLLAKRIIRRST